MFIIVIIIILMKLLNNCFFQRGVNIYQCSKYLNGFGDVVINYKFG